MRAVWSSGRNNSYENEGKTANLIWGGIKNRPVPREFPGGNLGKVSQETSYL